VERVALISDIHGNMTALTAVLADIEARRITRIICLGDLVGKGPSSHTVVDVIAERCETVIRGNWDDFIANPSERPAFRWYQEQLGRDRLDYVTSLPLCLDIMVSGRLVRLFHASQESVHVRVLMSAGEERHLEMFASTDLTGVGPEPDVVGYGDIHRAYNMSYKHRMLFNVGSVGNPLDGTMASYGIIEGAFNDPTNNPKEPATFGIQLVKVGYDTTRELTLARQADMPDYLAYEFELTEGRYGGSLRE
jgi:protein phosphatase